MKTFLKTLFVLFIVGMQLSFTVTTEEKMDCSMLRNGGTFTFTDDNGEQVVVIIEGESHTEYYNDKKYSVESKIKWVNDCEFNLTLVKASLPEFPFSQGTVLNITIDSIEGDFINYTGKIKGQTYKGTLRKQAPEGTNNK